MGWITKRTAGAEVGFSLLESVISLFFFLLIVLFSLDCFMVTKKHFGQLQESEKSNTAAYAALDRMRRDILDAGLGLMKPMALKILEGISQDQEKLIILSKDKDLAGTGDLESGQQRIPLAQSQNLKSGQLICILSSDSGEVHSIVSTTQDSILLDTPLDSNYLHEKTSLFSLRRVSLFFDENAQIIRRKVNASPAQPLLEEVSLFECDFLRDSNLVRLHFCLMIDEERHYETTVFPKNTVLFHVE